jgi:hypothetical protein
MAFNEIIETTFGIISDFKETAFFVPGGLNLLRRYENILKTDIESVEDERRVYKAAQEILKIIRAEYDDIEGGLIVAVIDTLQRDIEESLRSSD